MNAILRAAAYIPLKLKIEIMDNYYPKAVDNDFEAYKELYYAYRDYITGDKHSMTLNCEACQTKVMTGFRQIVKHWDNG